MEKLYQWLKDGNYNELIDFLKNAKNSKLIENDTGVKNAVQMFFNDILHWKIKKDNPNPEYKIVFEDLFLLQTGKLYTLNPNDFEIVIVELVKLSMPDLPNANKYASYFPENSLCKQIIERYNENKVAKVEHSQDYKIHFSESKPSEVNITKSLFFSEQEKIFYYALRNAYPTYLVLPNVAFRAIVDFDTIGEHLSPKEITFFNNSLIDFVIVDQFNNYIPKIAFELDSIFHRSQVQQDRDLIKNKILNLCGLQLYRIEHTQKEKDVSEFEKLLIEIIKR